LSRQRGSVLVLVLFVMTVLALTAVSFSYWTALRTRSARDDALIVQLQAHAASAEAIAIARLMENVNDYDHPAEPWHAHPPLAGGNWLEEWTEQDPDSPPNFVTDYQVLDEEGKLHVLFASSEALEKLGMSEEQIASLMDWMDGDDVARSDGAESDYYLAGAHPYYCKNAPLEMLDELLLIRGFHPQDYLGEDVNRNGVLDPNEDDGSLTYPPDDADGRLRMGWVALLTCLGDGRVNLNTAPEAVLRALPITEEAVGQIVGFRAFDENSSGKLEDHVFRSELDIEQLQGLTDADVLVLKQVATFRSRHFRIFVQSTHFPTGLRYHLEVLVRMGEDGPEILQRKGGG
jgi:hypothetical protein